jgi:predicted permease
MERDRRTREAREIIGILPRNFRFLDEQDVSLILPLKLDRNQTTLGNFSYFGIARLKAGVTLAQASADVARMLPITLRAFPPQPGLSVELLENARLVPNLLPLKQDVVGSVGTLLWVLMGGVAMVLLIACANVANLLLVRTAGRRTELTLRVALGASRGRIAVQLLCESALLGLLGGILSLGLSWAALRLLVRLAPSGLPRVGDIGVDVAVLCFTLGIAVSTSLLFGLIPVFKHAGARAGLPESGRTLGPSRERQRAQDSLVTVQVALALVLLVCAGLMLRTFRMLTRVDPGFVSPALVQTFRVAIPPLDVPDGAGVSRLEQRIQERLAAIPGVAAAGFASAVPMDGDNRLDNVFVADRTYEQGSLPPLQHLVFISPGYLHTLGIPVRAGRDLDWTETYNRVPVALVSESFAREHWRTPAEALGRRIRLSSVDDWREIIGVVGDVHDQGVDRPARSTVYWPTLLARSQSQPFRVQRTVTFVVRSPLAVGKPHETGPPGGGVRGCQSAARARPHAEPFLCPIHGAHVVHLGHARHRGGYGAAARHRGSLWRHCLVGLAAHARDRRPDGLGCAITDDPGAHRRPRHGHHLRGLSRRHRRRARAHAPAVYAAAVSPVGEERPCRSLTATWW